MHITSILYAYVYMYLCVAMYVSVYFKVTYIKKDQQVTYVCIYVYAFKDYIITCGRHDLTL